MNTFQFITRPVCRFALFVTFVLACATAYADDVTGMTADQRAVQNQERAGTIRFKYLKYTVNENDGQATITVIRAGGRAGSVSVDFKAEGATATSGVDFLLTNGTLVFGTQELVKTFTVPIVDNNLIEPVEKVNLTLFNPSPGAILPLLSSRRVLTIFDNDSSFALSTNVVIGTEGRSITITVRRAGNLSAPATVDYFTQDGSANGADYLPTHGTLIFPAMVRLKRFSVPLRTDLTDEAQETFTVSLENATGGALLGEPQQAEIRINNVRAPIPTGFYFTATTSPGGSFNASYAGRLVGVFGFFNGILTLIAVDPVPLRPQRDIAIAALFPANPVVPFTIPLGDIRESNAKYRIGNTAQIWQTTGDAPGTLTITEFDTVHGIIGGTFAFAAPADLESDATGTVTVTNGRFRVRSQLLGP